MSAAIEYDPQGRMKYHPEFHPRHKKAIILTGRKP